MGDYEQTMLIHADPQRIFDFVSDVRNLPKYLPTTKAAQPQGPNRVRVQGSAHGHDYNSDGYLRPMHDRHRLEWGADEGYYSGWMQIRPDGDGSFVTVHISLQDASRGPDKGPTDEDINEGLVASLRSIENMVTGQGGKQEPRAAT